MVKFDIGTREDTAVHEDWKAERGLNVPLGADHEAFALSESMDLSTGIRSGHGGGYNGFGDGMPQERKDLYESGGGIGDGYCDGYGDWFGGGEGCGAYFYAQSYEGHEPQTRQ